MTNSGKKILVDETHPMGQSLSTIEIHTDGFEHDLSEKMEDCNPISDAVH